MKFIYQKLILIFVQIRIFLFEIKSKFQFKGKIKKILSRSEKGDVPGWILVVLMTTALVTGIWSIAAPRLSTILKDSLDSMGTIR